MEKAVTTISHSRSGIANRLRYLLLVPLMLCALAQPALAETYFSLDGSKLTLQTEDDEELSPGGLRFRVGTQLSTFMDVEGHLGFSFTDDSETYDELSTTYFGGFLKGYVPLGEQSALFGLVGWTAMSVADYMSYIRDDGLFEQISSVNIGIKLYF